MNSPFVVEQARHLAARVEIASEKEPRRRLEALYRLVVGREPTKFEMEQGLDFVDSQTDGSLPMSGQPPSVWQYGVGEYGTSSEHLKTFRPFQYFTGDAWQPVPMLPSRDLSQAQLTADGGEAADDPRFVVVRRWVSPLAGKVSINGTLRHVQAKFSKGDGIRGRILSNREGEMASWTVKGVEAVTKLSGIEVKAGDTFDFVVEGRDDSEGDAFVWAPAIEAVPVEGAKPDQPLKWSASADFRGPQPAPLSKWEQYAQVLLETNEFAFVE